MNNFNPMIRGKILSVNCGNCLLSARKYTYSLNSKRLARFIGLKFREIKPEIALLQEVWTFGKEICGNNYEIIGLNDTIAVRKDFGHIIKKTFRSHALKFKKNVKSLIFPNSKNTDELNKWKDMLSKIPYKGYYHDFPGIPADFDLISVIIKVKNYKIMIGNAHFISGGKFKDGARARQIEIWMGRDFLKRAIKESEGRFILGGDFNFDYNKEKNSISGRVLSALISKYHINIAGGSDSRSTMNIPFMKKRLDYIMGSVKFSDYQTDILLPKNHLRNIKKRYPLLWRMMLDHKAVWAHFEFR